jgi:hypothetical protein
MPHKFVQEAEIVFRARPLRMRVYRFVLGLIRLGPESLQVWVVRRAFENLRRTLTRDGYHPITQRQIVLEMMDVVERVRADRAAQGKETRK